LLAASAAPGRLVWQKPSKSGNSITVGTGGPGGGSFMGNPGQTGRSQQTFTWP